MKKLIALSLVMLLSFFAFAGGSKEETASDGGYLIGVSKLMSHAALDAVEEGMQDYLATTDLSVSYDFQNANGDISTSATIAQLFRDENVDVAVGIATPTAQALANIFTDVPVVFAAVTDPVDAGLVPSLEGSEDTNVCGVSDLSPVESQIKLLMDVTGAKVIGNIYASGEANGVALRNMAQEAVEKLGGTFVDAAITNSSEVMMAAQSIIDRVDAIYIATDNAVISALSAVDQVCSQAGKPLFSSDPSGIAGLDCLIAWGFNYYSIGEATGKAIESILKGTPSGTIGTIMLTDPADFELWFNLDTAEKLGIEIPQEYLDMAAVIIQNGETITK